MSVWSRCSESNTTMASTTASLCQLSLVDIDLWIDMHILCCGNHSRTLHSLVTRLLLMSICATTIVGRREMLLLRLFRPARMRSLLLAMICATLINSEGMIFVRFHPQYHLVYMLGFHEIWHSIGTLPCVCCSSTPHSDSRLTGHSPGRTVIN